MSAAMLVAPLAAITGADIFGLVVSALVCLYLLYALLRGEKL
jgi:K+-transporting ATPase KdpF subunit